MIRALRLGGLVAILAGMLLGLLTLASPPAEAQVVFPVEMNEQFARLHVVQEGQPCPAGHTDVGPISFNPVFRWCSPDGYNRVVETIAECAEVIMQLGIGGFNPANEPAICFSFGGFLGPGQICQPPGIAASTPVGPVCFGPVYAIGGGGHVTSAQPICIEDAAVQADEDLADNTVGSVYFDDDDVARVIVTGTPSCAFNCADGFDANCDGELGDFCAVELNPNLVRDVGTCLAALAPASVPAATTAPAPAAAVAISVDSALAHTGPSDVLPPVAFWLLAIGSTTLAAAQHARGRRKQ